ncbi:MAG: hypothetical protein IPP78_10565 [Holophagaceae bacterium]|nr:hypothetical protein [Holophagaceae bacterium]
MSAKIELPRSLLAGLVGVAALAVLGIVFLLGRESGRRHLEEARTGPRISSLMTPVAPAQERPLTPTISRGGSPSSEIPQPDPTTPPATTPSGTAIPPGDPARAFVAAYFQAVEAIQNPASGDPETIAQQVVAGLGKGDISGFDGMIQRAEATRNRLYAILPPQPCAAYHRESLASLDAGLGLMRDVKLALSAAGQEAAAIQLADRANALKARTDALQRQELALKQRYGLMK